MKRQLLLAAVAGLLLLLLLAGGSGAARDVLLFTSVSRHLDTPTFARNKTRECGVNDVTTMRAAAYLCPWSAALCCCQIQKIVHVFSLVSEVSIAH